MKQISKKVLRVRKYKAGYEVRTELWDNGGPATEMRSAYTPSGDYIGNPRVARYLCVKRGIKPEKASPDDNVCSIGFCEKEQRWYGWSHRAICGFGIGDRVFEERYGDEHTLFTQHGEVVIETLDQAREAAVNFARYVA